MKKIRISAALLSGVLALSLLLSACGGKKADPTSSPSTPAAEDTTTPAPAPEDTTTPDAAPEDTPASKPQSTPSSDPSNPETPAPTLTAADIWDTVSAGLELPAMMALDDEQLTALYGIDPADLEDYIAKVPMMNVHATEFLIARVKSGKMDTVKAACEKRQDDLVATWELYLPEQLELVENYQLVTGGDYLFFAVTEHTDAMVNAFQTCTK